MKPEDLIFMAWVGAVAIGVGMAIRYVVKDWDRTE